MRYCAGREKEKLELVGYSDSDMVDDVLIVRAPAG